MHARRPVRRPIRIPGGLRWRLTGWVAAVMIVSVAVIFYVVYRDTGTELRAQMDRDMSGDTTQLAQALSSHGGQSPAQIAATLTPTQSAAWLGDHDHRNR